MMNMFAMQDMAMRQMGSQGGRKGGFSQQQGGFIPLIMEFEDDDEDDVPSAEVIQAIKETTHK